MYLGSALKRSIPYAISDRKDMVQAYDGEGPDADEARQACIELNALKGIKPSKFTPEQRKTARMALLWAEQYLYGYMSAIVGIDAAEYAKSRKEWKQIRGVRLTHFGLTQLEGMLPRAELVDVEQICQLAAQGRIHNLRLSKE